MTSSQLMLQATNKTEIDIIGGMIVKISMISRNGTSWKANELCYVVANCEKLTLSREASVKLKMLVENFTKGRERTMRRAWGRPTRVQTLQQQRSVDAWRGEKPQSH